MNYDSKGFYWSYTEYTTTAQKQTNAIYIYGKLSVANWNMGLPGSLGCPAWTLEAISGLLGNAEAESQINPGLYNDRTIDPSKAFGLVQWWPGRIYLNWASSHGWPDYDMDYQLARLYYEENIPSGQDGHEWYIQRNANVLNGYGPYELSEYTFWQTSSQTPEWMAQAWLFNYERPNNPSRYAEYRGRLARKWYNYLIDQPTPPTPPGPCPTPGALPLWWQWKMRDILKQKGVDYQ